MTRIIMEELKGFTRADMALKGDFEASDYVARKVDDAVSRLLRDEPLQYIFGHARFYGMTIDVSPAVLIPRPETEGLVDIIVDDNGDREDLRVLDVCTGSGCIAIALARNLPFARVDAVDISDDALEVARQNVSRLHAGVTLSKADALSMPPAPDTYDIIVSNPPYIAEHERSAMARNVLDYEPAIALFVPDDDPLRFYHAIAAYSLVSLKSGGRLYFELNPDYADALAAELSGSGWKNVVVLPDARGKKRFMRAVKNEE